MKSGLIMLGLLALVTAGCGGGDDKAVSNRFGGRWAGTWTGATEAGTLNITVAQDGKITGSIVNATLDRTGTVEGYVYTDALILSTYTYPGVASISANGTVPLRSNGHWAGTLLEEQLGMQIGNITLDLIKQ